MILHDDDINDDDLAITIAEPFLRNRRAKNGNLIKIKLNKCPKITKGIITVILASRELCFNLNLFIS